jgi:hypothetical protein
VPPIIEPNTEIVCPDQSFKKSECRQRLPGLGLFIVLLPSYDPFENHSGPAWEEFDKNNQAGRTRFGPPLWLAVRCRPDLRAMPVFSVASMLKEIPL